MDPQVQALLLKQIESQNELLTALVGGGVPQQQTRQPWRTSAALKSNGELNLNDAGGISPEQSGLTSSHGVFGVQPNSPVITKQASSMDAQNLYSDGGLWSVPGIDSDVVTAYVRPYGISRVLPRFPSVIDNPYFGVITGIEENAGAEPTEPCDDGLTGYMTGAVLSNIFGRVQRATNTIEWARVKRQLNAGVNTDLTLRGRLLGLTDMNPSTMAEQQVLDLVTASEMVIAGNNIERKLGRMVWDGVIGGGNAGGYVEFNGLAAQITTGITDAVEGTTPQPALDSEVIDFNHVDLETAVDAFVQAMLDIEWSIFYNSEVMGLDPATWVLCLRPELWEIVSAIWPCAYYTNRCGSPGAGGEGTVVRLNDEFQIQVRDDMRRNMYIDINGRRYPVVTDTGIHVVDSVEDAVNYAAGEYGSDIFFVPLTITGGFPVCYVEYLSYVEAGWGLEVTGDNHEFWTDDGRFSWVYSGKKWCFKMDVKTEPRVILRTPQLAGRLSQVKFSPSRMLRTPYADEDGYKGGTISDRTGQTITL